MKMPNGQFSLWESEKLLGYGMCCMTLLCGFFIFFFSSLRNMPLWKDVVTLILFQARMDYRIFPLSLRKSVFISFLPLLQSYHKTLIRGSMFLVVRLLRN